MSTRLTLDPVSRVEGHLRVDLDIQDGVVVDAHISGTSFRGFEVILKGRDPRDAPTLTQRICGVCPVPHASAASQALEQIAATTLPAQALLLRNTIEAANFLESHLLHFYLLSLPDFVGGLPTGKRQTPRAFKQAPGLNAARLAEHAQRALSIRRELHNLGALFGGRMPHPVGILPGGVTARPTTAQLDQAKQLAATAHEFIQTSYAEDVAALCEAYPDEEERGRSAVGFLSFGGFRDPDGRALFAAGVLSAEGGVRPLSLDGLTESVATARYLESEPLHPQDGKTEISPSKAGAYTWIKAPRLDGNPLEVGPLARALINGHDPGGRGVLARHRARQAEALALVERLEGWLSGLNPEASAFSGLPMVPAEGRGAGLLEAPRGALGHWMTIKDGLIETYQVISPTTWNAACRDEAGLSSPLERALIGTPVAEAADPVEALRIVRAFDPCLQCSVH